MKSPAKSPSTPQRPIEKSQLSAPAAPLDQAKHSEKTTDAVAEPSDTGKPGYTIRYKFLPDRKLFYILENEFRDHGGVPRLLSYTTQVSDRRTIIQSVLTEEGHKPTADPDAPMVNLSWKYDRYEVSERGMKGKTAFDSLRNSYPKQSLRQLGTIPGTVITFAVQPITGQTHQQHITLGKLSGPATRRKLSRTAERCLPNDDNVRHLFDDMFTLFMPPSKVRIDQTWTTQRSQTLRNSDVAITDYTFTLDDVREIKDRKMAHISIRGKVDLQRPPGAGGASNRRRRTPQRVNAQRHDFQIDHALCEGSVDFDLTHGELVKMNLRRELDLSTQMKSEKKKSMKLETGFSHLLRVEVRQTPPPEPVIVGGPKPPVEEINEQAMTGRKTPSRNHRATSQKATRLNSAQRRSAIRRLREARHDYERTRPAQEKRITPRSGGTTTRPINHRMPRVGLNRSQMPLKAFRRNRATLRPDEVTVSQKSPTSKPTSQPAASGGKN